MSNQLQRVINLAKKTGDRVIVFDSVNPENTYVVMGLDEYEKILIGKNEVRGLTEEQLLDKINRDIAIWKTENDFGFFAENSFSPEEKNENDESETRKEKKSNWSIPKNVKEAAEEIMEEDRQYLEEVPF